MSNFLIKFELLAKQCEKFVLSAFFGHPPPPELLFSISTNNKINQLQSNSKFSLKDLIGDGFLFAVPKSRRTVEKRLSRKFGHPDYIWKLIKPKKNLQVCNTCGDDHESNKLCPTCYKRVIEETKQMQDVIQDTLKLDPVDKEVVVMYAGEKTDEFHDGKRIVEMPKERPAWFSKNLLQQTTQKLATTKDVKPSELG